MTFAIIRRLVTLVFFGTVLALAAPAATHGETYPYQGNNAGWVQRYQPEPWYGEPARPPVSVQAPQYNRAPRDCNHGRSQSGLPYLSEPYFNTYNSYPYQPAYAPRPTPYYSSYAPRPTPYYSGYGYRGQAPEAYTLHPWESPSRLMPLPSSAEVWFAWYIPRAGY